MKKSLLEITVDKTNEKGPDVFEHILIVLHKVFDKYTRHEFLNKTNILPTFSFEITKIGNNIRFFLVCPDKYKNFIKNQIYAHYNNVEINEVVDYLAKIPSEKITVWNVSFYKHNYYPIKNYVELQEMWSKEKVDPYSSITSSLSRTWKYSLNTIQINFHPIENNVWKKDFEETIKILISKKHPLHKDVLLSKWFKYIKLGLLPVTLLAKFVSIIAKPDSYRSEKELDLEKELKDIKEKEKTTMDEDKENIPLQIKNKLFLQWFACSINIIAASDDNMESRASVKEIYSTLGIYSGAWLNSFKLNYINKDDNSISLAKQRCLNNHFILNTKELAGLVHLPTTYVKTPWVNWVSSRNFEPPANLPLIEKWKDDLTPIWKTNFRGTNMTFGIWPSDRRRHMYIIWKTGMWKSTLLENMIIDDIQKWRWVAVIDPHGDLAETILWFIPKNRTNNVIVFDPSDKEWPIWFNMFDWVNPEHRSLIASWIVWIFKRIFWTSWGPRLEHILRNTIMSLLEYPWATLLSVPLMLTSDVYRSRVL